MIVRKMAWALVAATLLTSLLGAPARAAVSHRVWHWNVAGNTMHKGSTTDGLIPAAVSSITGARAVFASVNELCQQQFDALIQRLRTAGWPEDPANFARFEATIPGRAGGPCQGKAYGIGLFSKKPLGAADRITLPYDGNEPRKLLCAPLREQKRLRFCTTHSTFVDAFRLPQLTAIFERMDAYRAAGDQVIVAGDFNAAPNFERMNRFYSSQVNTPNNDGNTGHFREVDDADAAACPGYGEGTLQKADGGGPCRTGTKIDMIFTHDGDYVAASSSGDARPSPTTCAGNACSDHRILTGTVTLRPLEEGAVARAGNG
ncbi:endonuclease/exonuclease/phosphatase family protein [Nonomuraea sp. NPDC050547]|uniref:endonuclease/exonuclease/phosphatase family protein n=1 Tax=Nonomuraea sp. NPDC050547 TaxID=3364368 RepID=UPI0037954482